MAVLLALGWAAGWLVAWAWRWGWWLLRVLWALAWRLGVVALAVLVVAFHRPLAWRLLLLAAGAALTRRIVRRGGQGGRGPGQRTADNHGGSAPWRATPVKLRPVSAQAVATASYAETVFFTQALDGPGLLSMCVGPAGAGKSELAVFGALRAGVDGEAFGGEGGLATTRPGRTLLLSEMGGESLAPALRRWGFYAEPAGRFPRLDAVRLRLVPPRGHAGGLIDVLYAADVYAPVVVDGELRQAEWPAVVQAAGDLCARRGYARVVVDSLGEWMGSDSNDAMLRTLGACRQLTRLGVGVLVLHHVPRSDATRPRGGTVIEAKLDVGYSVTGLGAGGMPRSLADPQRRLRWFKTRFPERTPAEPLVLERVWAGQESGERPCYRLAGGCSGAEDPPAPERGGRDRLRAADQGAPAPLAPKPGALPPWEWAVLAQLVAHGGTGGATSGEIEAATGRPRQRVSEAMLELIRVGAVRVAGKAPTGRSGPAPTRYVATTHGRELLGCGGQAAEASGAADVAPIAIGGPGGPRGG